MPKQTPPRRLAMSEKADKLHALDGDVTEFRHVHHDADDLDYWEGEPRSAFEM
jgi:hypothetical protein